MWMTLELCPFGINNVQNVDRNLSTYYRRAITILLKVQLFQFKLDGPDIPEQ